MSFEGVTDDGFDPVLIVPDSLDDDGYSIPGDEIKLSGDEKTEHDSKVKGKRILDLNKLPNEAVALEIDHQDSEGPRFDAIVEDSLEKEAYSDYDGEETSLVRKRKSLHHEEFRGKKLQQLKIDPPAASSGTDGKKLIDLNEYPEEGPDFGFESPALNKEFLTMLRILLGKFP